MLSTRLPSISALAAQFSQNPTGPFLIASPSAFERRWIIEEVLGIKARYFRASETPLEAICEELSSPSLFGGEGWIVYDEIECIKKSLKSLGTFPHLILAGTRTEKGPFLTLDLTKEKPWEKKDRFMQMAHAEIKRRGKTLAPDAAVLLVANAEGDLSHLFQEIEKLSLFACDAETISRDAVLAIGSGEAAVSGWAKAEEIAFEKRCPRELPFSDVSTFHQLLGQLRYQLRLGLRLSLGETVENLRPKSAAKLTPLAKKHGSAHFQKGLAALFHMERKSKTTPIDPKILYTHFIAEIQQ